MSDEKKPFPFVVSTYSGNAYSRIERIGFVKKGTRMGSRDFEGKIPYLQEWDAIVVPGRGRYTLERGKCSQVRAIPDSYVRDLEVLDARIGELIRERRLLMEEAFRHGRPVTVKDATPPARPAKVEP